MQVVTAHMQSLYGDDTTPGLTTLHIKATLTQSLSVQIRRSHS